MRRAYLLSFSLTIFFLVAAAAWSQSVFVVGGINNRIDSDSVHPSLRSSELYNESTQTFTASGQMHVGRTGNAATVLQNGEILVTGGDSNVADAPTSSAELYNPSTGTFQITGNMSAGRVAHTSTLLPNGQVLIAGGQNKHFANLDTAELYDPTTGTFTATGNMTTARCGQTATLLNNGLVLVAGGQNNSGLLASAELYDPSTGTFTATGSMTTAREFPIANLLANGTVLIAGGGGNVGGCSGCSLASAEVYDPTTATFTAVGSMSYSRRGFVSAPLSSGDILVTGGIEDNNGQEEFLSSAEIFDQGSLTFSLTGSMISVRFDHAANLLENGNVLVTGGFTGSTITETAEVYDTSSGTFALTGNMLGARAEQTTNNMP